MSKKRSSKPQSTDSVSYSEKLRDPRWQKMRLEIMCRDNFACCRCSRDDKTLNVHHYYYKPKFNPWDYPDGALVTVCEDCHREMEDFYREMKLLIGVSQWRQSLFYEMLKATRINASAFDDHLSSVVSGLRFFLRMREFRKTATESHEKEDAIADMGCERDKIIASLNQIIKEACL